MNDFQPSNQGVLGQHMSWDGVELTSFTSVSSRATNDDQASALDRHKLDTSSSAALHWPLNSEESELAGQAPLQPSDNTQPHSSSPTSLKRRPALQRIGVQTIAVLVSTFVLMSAVLSFLAFLWTAPDENRFWRLIIVNGWAGSAVTVSSLLLRTAVSLQAGIVVAMIAAILLETGHVLLIDTAQVSKLRAGRAVPVDILVTYLRTIRHEWPRGVDGLLQVLTVLLLVLTTILHQLTSTMLISDLSLGVLPGKPQSEELQYDFKYEWSDLNHMWYYPAQYRAAEPWLRNPPAFPTFGEFSEQINVPEHVDDTGELFRALLPFQDAQSRETISQYSGKALVLDARVTCQRPQLQGLHIIYNDSMFSYVGTFSQTAEVPGLLGPARSVPFNCLYTSTVMESSFTFSICQPSGERYGDGKLLSKLRDVKQWSPIAKSWSNGSLFIENPLDRLSTAYLIFNTTLAALPEVDTDSAKNISANSGHEAWTDVSYLSLGSILEGRYVNLSVTLCYPAIWSARLSVALQSPHNRTEPRASSLDAIFHTTPDIHVQMGEFKHDQERSTLESRGVLSLSPRDSWLPDQVDAVQYDITGARAGISRPEAVEVLNSFIARSSKIRKGSYDDEPTNASLAWDLYLTSVEVNGLSPDFSLASIFTTSLQVTNGSAATALSTIITILASMTYYDQFPNFKETAHDVSTLYFQTFLFPQSLRGFTAVLAITAAHCLLVLLIIVSFTTSTRLTTLGDHWQSISQVVSPATERFLAKSSHATDKEVRRCLKAEHREKETALIQPLVVEGEARIGVVARRARRRSSDSR